MFVQVDCLDRGAVRTKFEELIIHTKDLSTIRKPEKDINLH